MEACWYTHVFEEAWFTPILIVCNRSFHGLWDAADCRRLDVKPRQRGLIEIVGITSDDLLGGGRQGPVSRAVANFHIPEVADVVRVGGHPKTRQCLHDVAER